MGLRSRMPDPAQAALLVIDVQEYFRGMAEPILPALNRSIAAARAAGIPVVHTRHSHKDPSDYGMLGEWWDRNILDGTAGAELLPEVDRLDGDKIVHKRTYSGFYNTDLEDFLRKSGRKEVIVTGVMTNLCCETTARDAFVRGFRVFFSTDATATEEQDLHDSTIKNLSYGFAYLVDSSKLEANLAKK
ncbi:hypothetical protein SELMODRAFT_114562 [Selaginella moellendorffii]|uniref:Isochorismatase-like domain-containing protein n=1 Tax=Selaginella moellendorffii TaxID=88036 RepID=D8SD73_SELML|nr:nicotinamidase 2 [Selaginella moellendorffii]XP_024542151.1 nicotinamidase 2 [Selaginella moellendorffii]EFJ17573.1 hypothetical protein SELMODRAFT_114562 [Selaginella moellendorffii]|eukprot:XP_002981385.1 nicotinamidase 2 [Selaginella moellendorffii]